MTIHTECFDNISADYQVDLFEFQQTRHEEIDAMYRVYFGWVPLPIAIIAIPFATIFVIGACRAITTRQASRKFYLLLVNRTIGDILYCISALVTSFYVLHVEHVSDIVIAIIENLATGSAWSVMISCVSLSVLKLYAVWKPFSYRKTVTLKRSIYLIVLSWTIFAIVVTYSLVTIAFTQVPKLREWSGCKFEVCFTTMGRSRHIVVLIVYFSTLIVLAITVVLVKRISSPANSFRGKNRLDNDKRQRFPIWKVTLNVGTFTLFGSFYVSWCIFLLSHRDGCFFIRNFFEVMRLLGIIR
uniref:G_PROTEIN_RECEP_F1_2 domain-containing protein n=1 Tax=Ascaris lumbricoides TaxID=6252 RepID=A0A0M3I7P2_ASCLU